MIFDLQFSIYSYSIEITNFAYFKYIKKMKKKYIYILMENKGTQTYKPNPTLKHIILLLLYFIHHVT